MLPRMDDERPAVDGRDFGRLLQAPQARGCADPGLVRRVGIVSQGVNWMKSNSSTPCRYVTVVGMHEYEYGTITLAIKPSNHGTRARAHGTSIVWCDVPFFPREPNATDFWMCICAVLAC